ncbi:UNVERIFIED_CONTAM: hypothetical protein FKN15_057397 [Acipenser sinensis]
MLVPCDSFCLSLQIRSKTAAFTDTRIRTMNEVVSGMRIIKMYAWEKPFAKLVTEIRRPTMQPTQSYSIGGQHSSEQLTGKPAGTRPDHRGRWCANGAPYSHLYHFIRGFTVTAQLALQADTLCLRTLPLLLQHREHGAFKL